jgi:Helicase associated domain
MASTMRASGVPIEHLCGVDGGGGKVVDSDATDNVDAIRRRASNTAAIGTATSSSSDILESKWRDRLRELVRYKERYGDCNVPFQFKEDQRLANWVLKQRKLYRKGELSPRRVRQLDDAGFMWTSYRRVTWEQRFDQLRLYRQRHGTTVVSEDRGVRGVAGGGGGGIRVLSPPPIDADTVALAQWVKKQRTTQRKKEMGPERVAMLDSIGFVWDVEDSSWEGRFLELVQFVRAHGTYVNPKDAGLKGWVYRQRYKYHENALSDDKRRKLDAIGFQWGQPCANVGGKKDNVKRKHSHNRGSSVGSNVSTGAPGNPNPLSSLVSACMLVGTNNTRPSQQGALNSESPPPVASATATHPGETDAAQTETSSSPIPSLSPGNQLAVDVAGCRRGT